MRARDPPQASIDSKQLAAAKVGEFYEHGQGGVEKSLELAREFYTKAGAKGADGLVGLEEADRIMANVLRLTEAAEGGDADSQLQLAQIYEYGQGGRAVDLERAEQLYRKAADAGIAQAQYMFGRFLIKTVAKKYLQLAGNQGYSDGSYLSQKIDWNF